jgi:N-acetyl-gamma-glutamylphosphate reductase
MSSTGKSALLIGATGATGKHLLKELLGSPHFTRVGEYGRRVTSLDQLSNGKEKLEQKTIDFENLAGAGLAEGKWDVVFITYVIEHDLRASRARRFTRSTGLGQRERRQEAQKLLKRSTESKCNTNRSI